MKLTIDILKEAKAVKTVLCALDTKTKNDALLKMAEALIEYKNEILEENKAQRHIRGGIATQRKYRGTPK